MSDQLEKLLAQKRMEKPANGWRNWYNNFATVETKGGDSILKGVQPGYKPWPSKDTAETFAREWLRKNGDGKTAWEGEYLGAFPEGERP